MSSLAQIELELESYMQFEELTVNCVHSSGSRSVMDSGVFRWVVIESNRFQEQLRVRVETQIQCQVAEDNFSLAKSFTTSSLAQLSFRQSFLQLLLY